MARPLLIPIQSLHSLPESFTFFLVFAAVFAAMALLCGSRGGEKQQTVRLGGKNKAAALKEVKSRLSSKAVSIAKMISGRKAEEEDEDGGAVWKKTIIKGDKCRPLDFSGRILYDADGNILPE